MKENKGNKRDRRLLITHDEFGEEAGEGLGQLSRDEAEADLAELKGRLERRIGRQSYAWLPAAAAVAILLIASAVIVTLLRDRSVHEMKLAEAGEAITDTALIAMAQPIEKKPTVVAEEDREIIMEMVEIDLAESDSDILLKTGEAEVPAIRRPAAAVLAAGPVRQADKLAEAVPRTERDTDQFRMIAVLEAEAEETPQAPAVTVKQVSGERFLPLGGWESYREWLAENLRYPRDTKRVAGARVIVSFTVQADSTVTDLKAQRSPGQPFTEEVFRLLREGPKWVPSDDSNEKRHQRTVTLQFFFR